MKFTILIFLLISIFSLTDKPNYDHQTETYYAKFNPVETYDSVSIAPFFSPDHSLDTHVNLIENAKYSVDIMIPSFGQFSYCHFGQSCAGCYISFWKTQSGFPIWQALVNAVHRGIKVRILTNNYEDIACKNQVTNLDYLLLAGAEVKYFKTVSFTHTKFMMIDGQISLVSSVNYSKTSLMKNREAGIIIAQEGRKVITQFLNQVFESDFNAGLTLKTYNYTLSDWEWAIVRNKTPIPLTFPNPYKFTCQIESPIPNPIFEQMRVRIFASPDFAFDEVMNGIRNATKSFKIAIYEISHPSLVDALIDLKNRGINPQIFVSHDVYGIEEGKQAVEAYKKLYSVGIVVNLSAPSCLQYSHQKYWIIDDKVVYLSTGNWAPTDYPEPPYVFPPYSEQSTTWRKVNRDFTVKIENSQQILERFQSVFNLDMSQSVPFNPEQKK